VGGGGREGEGVGWRGEREEGLSGGGEGREKGVGWKGEGGERGLGREDSVFRG